MVMRLFLNGLAMVVVAGDCLQSLVLGHDQVVAHHYTSVQVRFKFTPVLYIKLISSSCRFLLPTRLVHLTKSIPCQETRTPVIFFPIFSLWTLSFLLSPTTFPLNVPPNRPHSPPSLVFIVASSLT